MHEVVDGSGNMRVFENENEEPTSDRLLTQMGRGDTVVDSSIHKVACSDADVNGVLKSSCNQTEADSFKKQFGDWQNALFSFGKGMY